MIEMEYLSKMLSTGGLTMAEYIDREVLIKEIEADFNTDWADYARKNNFDKDYIDGVRDEYDDTLKIICQQKTVDVQPVNHGRWECVGHDDATYWYRCSVCRHKGHDNMTKHDNYCCNCGADMREAENDDSIL